MYRRQFLATTGLALAASFAEAADKHWLVGPWEGEVRGLGNNRTGSMRSFIISSVSPDGASAQGTWTTNSGRSGGVTLTKE